MFAENTCKIMSNVIHEILNKNNIKSIYDLCATTPHKLSIYYFNKEMSILELFLKIILSQLRDFHLRNTIIIY